MKEEIQNFLIKLDSSLDTSCPTNISLSELGKFITNVDIVFPQDFLLLKQKYVKFCGYNILNSKDKEDFKFWITFLGVIFTVELFKKNIKFCNNEIFQLVISKLHSFHLFKQHGLSGSIDYLADELTKKYFNNVNIENLYKLIYELRHRLSQSIKAIAKKYMYIIKDPQTTKQDCNITSTALANQLLIYGFQLNSKQYNVSVSQEDLFTLLLSLCQHSSNSGQYLAKFFKDENIKDQKEKSDIIKYFLRLFK